VYLFARIIFCLALSFRILCCLGELKTSSFSLEFVRFVSREKRYIKANDVFDTNGDGFRRGASFVKVVTFKAQFLSESSRETDICAREKGRFFVASLDG
jgi:hypothetical protein